MNNEEQEFASRLSEVMKEQGRKWGWLAKKLDMNNPKICRCVKQDLFTTKQENKIKEILGF